ncbi:HAMP domain-containing histidine kinase [Enterocloster sp. OA13]|uniref:HAMP domain-containing sensor histidine kinase n=1 Tax=Enterocloster sp. OA13 TaxID=2914161 RepID=UPI000E71E298|nr:HAMP domain-containing histidine kinase [Enterocloster sp. OA13]RJW54148.1 sensor histidine kinase [Clostridiales bacterium TF09-2AC]
MKLWQRFCLWPLTFFLVIFLGTGILLMEQNTRQVFGLNLNQLSEERKSITEGLKWYIYTSSVRDSRRGLGRTNGYIREYMENRSRIRGVYYLITEAGENTQEVYSNLDLELPVMPMEEMTYTPQYKILQYGEKQFLRLSSLFTLPYQTYGATCFMEITDFVQNRGRQYRYFLGLFFVTAAVLAVGMYGISRHLTKSVRLLTDSIRKTGNGNYTELVEVRGNDEISELAARYNEMARAVKEKISALEKTTEEQRRFIDNFSHELRTPLTAVVGYADLLRSADLDQDTSQELGERIFKQGKRIEKLSELMLQLVFLEHHSFELVPCDLREVVMEAETILQPSVQKAQMKLIVLVPEEPVMIRAERDLLLNLLGNLTDNARKASKEGDTIRISIGREAGEAIVEIEDEGEGIQEEEQKKVFETFYMVDKVRGRRNQGVGLGLSICSDIVKLHHARLELVSKVKVGTKFTIIFPMLQS